MERLSRRIFFHRAGGAAAVVGAMAVVPIGVAKAGSGALVEPELGITEDLGANEHLVAHVLNARTGEISLLIGQREVIIHDRKVAARLVRAAR